MPLSCFGYQKLLKKEVFGKYCISSFKKKEDPRLVVDTKMDSNRSIEEKA